MKTENQNFLGRILDKMRPSDLLHFEHRLALSKRVDHLLNETGLDRLQFGSFVRKEVSVLRSWLSETKELSLETLAEICTLLHISLGDLVTEHA